MTYKENFVKFMADAGVLLIGDFTLKSGRKAPYFINTGNYKTGRQIAELGLYYATCIKENNIAFDTLFGPAYKGIPLSVSTAIGLSNKYAIDANYCFNRAAAKDHGEGGMIVGKQLTDNERILIVEDVMTSGKALHEVMPILKAAANVTISGMVISVDRMEKAGDSDLSAVARAKEEFGIDVYSIVTIHDIIAAIEDGIIPGKEFLPAIKAYLAEYGC